MQANSDNPAPYLVSHPTPHAERAVIDAWGQVLGVTSWYTLSVHLLEPATK